MRAGQGRAGQVLLDTGVNLLMPICPERSDFRLERADFRPHRAYFRAERAEYKPRRVDLWS